MELLMLMTFKEHPIIFQIQEHSTFLDMWNYCTPGIQQKKKNDNRFCFL